jgi:hypothetical protein
MWAEISIKLGQEDGIDLTNLRPSSGDSGGTVLLGANNSCLSAYLQHDLASYRMGGLRRATTQKGLILVLNEGPSALRPTAQYPELGPTFHTDALRWGEPKDTPLESGLFSGAITEASPDIEKELKSLDAIASVSPNASAQLASLRAFRRMVHLQRTVAPTVNHETAIGEAYQATLSWWVIPWLFTGGVTKQNLSSIPELPTKDPLVAKSILVWFGAEDHASD